MLFARLPTVCRARAAVFEADGRCVQKKWNNKEAAMGMCRIRIQDITGSRNCEVEAPNDVPVNRILILLTERLNLPLTSPDGQIMSYKLHNRRSGRQLLDEETLEAAGVRQDDELRLQPEITAG